MNRDLINAWVWRLLFGFELDFWMVVIWHLPAKAGPGLMVKKPH